MTPPNASVCVADTVDDAIEQISADRFGIDQELLPQRSSSPLM